MSGVGGGPLHLVQSPHITHLVLLMFTLDDLNLILHRLLMKHWTHQVGNKPSNVRERHRISINFNYLMITPVQGIKEMLLWNIKVEICVG